MIQDSGTRVKLDTGATREDKTGKGRMDLLPYEGLRIAAVRMEEGIPKYGLEDWKRGVPVRNLLSSAVRHTYQHIEGMTDEDHLAAAICDLLMVAHTEKYHPELDTRGEWNE